MLPICTNSSPLLLWFATYELGKCIVSRIATQIRNKEEIVLVILTYLDINDEAACHQTRQPCSFSVKGQSIWMQARALAQ